MSVIEVMKNATARIAVTRVRVLPTPRAENSEPPPPPPPMPRAPPSERCSRTTPIKRQSDEEMDDEDHSQHGRGLSGGCDAGVA